MRRSVLCIFGILAVSGCTSPQPVNMADSSSATPHHYTSVRESFFATVPPRMTPKMDRAGIPTQLQQQLFDCMWQAVWGSFTPDEQAALDTSIRTEKRVPDQAMREDMQRKIGKFMGDDPLTELRSTCPETVTQLSAYLH